MASCVNIDRVCSEDSSYLEEISNQPNTSEHACLALTITACMQGRVSEACLAPAAECLHLTDGRLHPRS